MYVCVAHLQMNARVAKNFDGLQKVGHPALHLWRIRHGLVEELRFA